MSAQVDGIHFGTGEDMTSGFFGLADPESPTVINEPEAKWYYAAIQEQRPGARNVWRASPVVKPEYVGWDARIFSRAIFQGIDEHYQLRPDRNRTHVCPTDILLLNELNLDYERGRSKGDNGAFDTNPANWPGLYAQISEFLAGLLPACRERAHDRGFDPVFWFPAWAPGHGEFRPEIANIWTPVAQLYDAVSLHSYSDADTITSDVLWYLDQFPDKPIGLFEWNTINHGKPNSFVRYQEEIRIRGRLQALGRSYSRLSACYFIYAWANDDQHEHDIKDNEFRTRIWDGSEPIPYDSWAPVPGNPIPDPEPPPDPPKEPPVADFPLGIDVSNNNGGIDWDAVKGAGVEFAIAKITEGVGFYDSWFLNHWSNMKRVGLIRGAYHYALPSETSATAEAEFFVRSLGSALEPGDLVALDLEDPKAFGDLSVWVREWCRYVTAALGFAPLIYSSPAYITERRLRNAPELGDLGLWCASWGVPTPPPAPAPWDLVAIHQYAVGAPGTIPGVSGEIDLNRYNGPIETLRAYGKPGEVVVPEPEPLPGTDYVIGEGIAALMRDYGAIPASSEVDSPFWVEAMDTDGRIYRYVKATNKNYVYEPE